MKVPFAEVDCSGNELKYVSEVLASGWLTTASKTHELERRFSEMTAAKHAIAVNSCTSALHLAVEALGIGPQDQVIVPTLTFTASAEVIRYMGADPLFVDIDPDTLTITPKILERTLQLHPNVKAVIVVHYGGQSAQMLSQAGQAGILEICKKYDVKVIEDAAHALPAHHQGQMVGNFGDITCFSFYANKTMTTGEGGMLLTSNDEIAHRARTMRLHGIDRDAWDRFTSNKPAWEYDVVAPGFKYNLPDLNAAVGLAQLERLEEFRAARQKIADFYRETLSIMPFVKSQQLIETSESHAWHIFPIIVDVVSAEQRNKLIEVLFERGIGTSVHYKPLHRTQYYQEKYQLKADNYPNADHYWARCLSLPIYSKMTIDQATTVCECLYAAYREL